MTTEHDLAAEAYVYYFPLVFNLGEVGRAVTDGFGALAAAPFNTFAHGDRLATDNEKFVSVNNDTIYSIAQLDLSNGPLLLTVPPTGDRYVVLQFVDAWTNNFAYVGTRATGNEGGDFLIVPPGAGSEADDGGPRRIEAPTTIVSIVGRFACDGTDDIPAVRAMQEQLTLTPVLRSLVPPRGVVEPAAVDADLAFWEKARAFSLAYPPAERDVEYAARFAELGLTDAESPFVEASADLRERLVAGAAGGEALIAAASRAGAPGESWSSLPHAFDYNIDFFGVGTIDSPEWTITEPERRFTTRAFAAKVGLWGNHGYEATYAQTFLDADGDALDGTKAYTIRFDTPPPVDAFWSITMYDLPDYYLVANPIGRYSVGDRTPGIVRAADGSITLTLSHDEPTDADARANWLPAPAAPFRPMIRLYSPRESVLDGTYRLPAIEKA
ncbi:DUF1254 domain-containing protein [Agromyces atrinae]|uniref:DUF1254 domain-containing protein n=1 Tax=Agromyces atrinae TaxID=592376 RepID=UPI001F5ADFAE|nr:DUF1254 domain-containing protein [Agromyces atrinae]MCI2956626.1 DUF1254 domain-containing protein [Agromyces atrinae]